MRAGVSREKDAIINIDDVEPYCYILRRKPPKLQLKKLTAKSIMEIFGMFLAQSKNRTNLIVPVSFQVL